MTATFCTAAGTVASARAERAKSLRAERASGPAQRPHVASPRQDVLAEPPHPSFALGGRELAARLDRALNAWKGDLFRSRDDAAAQRPACRRPAGEDRASLSPPAPFAAELRPIVQPLPDLALEAAFGRIVELAGGRAIPGNSPGRRTRLRLSWSYS